jgi:hypothetical protein
VLDERTTVHYGYSRLIIVSLGLWGVNDVFAKALHESTSTLCSLKSTFANSADLERPAPSKGRTKDGALANWPWTWTVPRGAFPSLPKGL